MFRRSTRLRKGALGQISIDRPNDGQPSLRDRTAQIQQQRAIKKETRPTRACRDDGNEGNRSHENPITTTKPDRRLRGTVPTPSIAVVRLLFFFVDLPLSFPTDNNNEYVHTTESTPHNNRSDSVFDERVSRSNQNKPAQTQNNQKRNVRTTSSNRPTPFRSRLDPTATQAQWQTLNGVVPEQ